MNPVKEEAIFIKSLFWMRYIFFDWVYMQDFLEKNGFSYILLFIFLRNSPV
jgi:hypothetical protein